MAKSVIFDMDGTILNTLDDLTESVNYALSQFGFPIRTKDEVRRFVGDGIQMLFERALPENTDNKITKNCIQVFKKHYSSNMYNKTAPYEGIIEVLQELKATGISTGVVSNKFDSAVKNLCKKYFGNLIDTAVGQSDEIPPKPSNKGVIKVLNILNSESAIFVGDSDVDVKTAKNSNLISIGVTWGFRDEKNLKDADYIANYPSELTGIIKNIIANLP